jgi:hypothetical protein
VLPERLDADYVARTAPAAAGDAAPAILGSFERFIGIMIENYGRRFPDVAGAGRWWWRPSPPTPTTIAGGAGTSRQGGLRVESDLRNEKINYKVREHSVAKVPVIAVVGRREAEEGKVRCVTWAPTDRTITHGRGSRRPLTQEACRLTCGPRALRRRRAGRCGRRARSGSKRSRNASGRASPHPPSSPPRRGATAAGLVGRGRRGGFVQVGIRSRRAGGRETSRGTIRRHCRGTS